LIQLDVHFRPLKAAVFSSGEIMVLGWDEGNLLPVLAILREDGTVRSFVALAEPKLNQIRRRGDAAARTVGSTTATGELLRGAAFVPYQGQVLLTFPGTRRPLILLGPGGDGHSIPVLLPAGLVLHDVVVSNGFGVLVLRTQAEVDPAKSTGDREAHEQQQRLFEVSDYDGLLRDELTFDVPKVSDVTCAVKSSLTAMFYDTIEGVDHALARAVQPSPAGSGSATEDVPTQLVISTARR